MSEAPVSSTLAAQSFAAGHVPKPASATDSATSRKAAEEFESFFLTQMLEHMFEGIETDGVFGGGYGEGVFRSMMLQEYGRILARSGGIGLADMVGRELLNLQETSQ